MVRVAPLAPAHGTRQFGRRLPQSPRSRFEDGDSLIVKSTTVLSLLGTLASLSVFVAAQALTASSASGAGTTGRNSSYAATQAPVNLGNARYFRILAQSGVSTTGTTRVRGNIGVSPIDSTALTGFGLTMDPSNLFSTSSLVGGKLMAADYAAPTHAFLTKAVHDMDAAYTDAAGRTLPDFTELGAGNIGGLTLAPGLYKWGTGVSIPSNGVTLAGSSTDIWIFQIAQDLTLSSGAIVHLTGGARANQVFWQVAGKATLGTTSRFNGILLCKTKIVMDTGARLNGRALAQTAVTLDSNGVYSN